MGQQTWRAVADLERWSAGELIKQNAGGERREIGPSAKGSLSDGSRAERFEPEGPKNPEGERRLDNQTRTQRWELDNGSVTLRAPRLGQNEPGRRSCRPNGSRAKHCGAVKKQAGSFDLSMVAR